MSRMDGSQGLLPSMLNRLLDPDSAGTVAMPGYSLRQMIDAVRADLEDLLNTRQTLRRLPVDYPETQNSIVTYGLPDFATYDPSLAGSRQAIARAIEAIIARFEPRLRDVRARLARKGDKSTHLLNIHIDAQLRWEPFPQVGFDTLLELRTGHASVELSPEVA